MGIIFPFAVFLIAGAFDVSRSRSVVIEWGIYLLGLFLIALPVLFFLRERKLNKQAASKLIAPAYLLGYAAAAAAALYSVYCIIDYDKLFNGDTEGGLLISTASFALIFGLGWAVLFRIGAAAFSLIKKR